MGRDTGVVLLTRRLAVNGVDLAWDEWGGGDGSRPLVLVHGYTGSAADFAGVVPELARGRPVVAADLRGHGASSRLGSVAGYSTALLRADVVALVEAVVSHHGDTVDVLGHSLGGYLTAWLAVDRPDLVHSLILMDTAAWPMAGGEAREMALAFLTSFDPAAGSAELGAGVAPEIPAGVDPSAFKALGVELLDRDLPSARPQLGRFARPVTVLAGGDDHPFVDVAADLAGCFPVARVAVIDGAGHAPQQSHPDEWIEIVEDHLAWAAGGRAAPTAPQTTQ
jgi:pimeloyl-ACP methyl ester carboxylesterase